MPPLFYIFLIFWSHSWLFSLDHQVFIYVDNCRLAVGVRAALMLRPLYRASRPVTQYIKITLTLSPLSPPLTLTGMDFYIYHHPALVSGERGGWLLVLFVVFFRAGSLLSPKVQTSNGSFRPPAPHKRPLLSTLQKPDACISPLTNGHPAGPKSPKSSSNLSSWKEEADLSTAALQFHQNKKRKRKKKKRRNTEEQAGVEPAVPAAVESQVDQMRKKRKKKRKRENAEENMKERGCVPSHLDTSNHEEDWCPGGIWSLTSRSDAEEPEPKCQLAATAESEKAKKRKKKRKRTETLLDTSASSVAETWVYISALLHTSHK